MIDGSANLAFNVAGAVARAAELKHLLAQDVSMHIQYYIDVLFGSIHYTSSLLYAIRVIGTLLYELQCLQLENLTTREFTHFIG